MTAPYVPSSFSDLDGQAQQPQVAGLPAALAAKAPLPALSWSLPTTMYAVVGHEFNVYFDNVALTEVPFEQLRFSVTASIGFFLDEKFACTPLVGDIGTHVVTFQAYYNGTLLAQASTNLVVKAATAASPVTRQVLAVGDSLTQNGVWLAELVNLCNHNNTSPVAGGVADNLTITTVGRLTPSPIPTDAGGTARTVKTEATGGWSANMYWSSSSSPFWFAGAFSAAAYCAANNLTLAAGDWVLLETGVNDVFFSTSDDDAQAKIATSLAALDGMIANWKTVQAGLRFGICTPPPPAATQDAFGIVYVFGQMVNGVTTFGRAYHKRWVTLLQQAQMNHFGQSGANNVWICPLHANLDTVLDFPTTATPASARNPTIVGRITNALHPLGSVGQTAGSAGQWHFADTVYYFLRGQES